MAADDFAVQAGLTVSLTAAYSRLQSLCRLAGGRRRMAGTTTSSGASTRRGGRCVLHKQSHWLRPLPVSAWAAAGWPDAAAGRC